MKTSEKVISAGVTIAIGVLLLVFQARVIDWLMTVVGVSIVILGIIDLFYKQVPPAVVKIVIGGLIILFGWLLTSAVLYILAAILLIVGILMLYDKIKRRVYCKDIVHTILEYAVPGLFILIGVMFLFQQGEMLNIVFIISGILTIAEGGVLLATALWKD